LLAAPAWRGSRWTYEEMRDIVAMLARHGLELAALENFSPNFWSDVLLDGLRKREQIEGLKRLVRDAGRAGVPCIGYAMVSPGYATFDPNLPRRVGAKNRPDG
jgi:D-mannonate dehydratase